MSDLTPMRMIWLGFALIAGGIALWAAPDAAALWGARLGGAVLVIWCLTETVMRRNWLALCAIPALWVGLGLALPLYLFFRSAKVV